MQNDIIKKLLKALNPLSCVQARRRLEKFWRDELSAEEEKEVREHLVVCEECVEAFGNIVAETACSAAEGVNVSSRPKPGDGETEALGQLWIGDERYNLKASTVEPGLLQVEDLAFIKLQKRRQQDLLKAGSCNVQIERGGQALVIPLSKFLDVGEHSSYKLAAADASFKSESAAEDSTAPLLKYRCKIDPWIVEVLVDREGFVFLRLNEVG